MTSPSAAIRSRLLSGLGLAVAAVLLAACGLSSTGTNAGTGDLGAPSPNATAAPTSASPSASPKPQAVVTISPAKALAPDSLVKVSVVHGTVDSVTMTGPDGELVNGTVSSDGTTWVAEPQQLTIHGKYRVDARALDASGLPTTKSVTLAVSNVSALHASITPNGTTVGVGMPVMVHLSTAPKDRAAVEKALTVTTTPAVAGAWHWYGSKELHWRPQTYWPANTKVSVAANLKGVHFGGSVWGDRNSQATFHIGDSMISTVDVSGDHMTVTRDGKVIRVIPITTGKPGYLTRNGVKIIMTKETSRIMDSTTVDIPAGSPDSYRLKVYWAMRLTYSGEFLHAAPWSVAHQGHSNVSHGCTGMSTANAKWLFDNSQIGDVVVYVHSTRPIEQGNGITDWNVPWSEWAD
jgi:lipoprotein-anchoring transpeptidase ErfK/SrfK